MGPMVLTEQATSFADTSSKKWIGILKRPLMNSKYTVGILLNVKTTLMISKKENGLLQKNNQNPRVRIPVAPNLIKITVILRTNFQMKAETDTNGLIGDLELILIETLDGETTIETGQINKMMTTITIVDHTVTRDLSHGQTEINNTEDTTTITPINVMNSVGIKE